MSNPFTLYAGTDPSVLVSSLLSPNSGVLVFSTVLSPSGGDAVNFYDGSLTALGIGAGLLFTTGTTPGMTNTVGWFGQDNSAASGFFYNGDADIDAVVNSVFQTQSYDATTLSFDFTVSDTAATSVSFDIVFGSDEYPEWVDQFVDCAIVTVNGVNYALFNHDPAHPLSVVSSNLAAGYFQDNAADPVTGASLLPIEYDGVSHGLKIIAPIIAGGATNHIKIGIADTGDHIYDSGMFIANFAAGVIPGSGVVSTQSGSCTESSDVVTGSTQDEYFDLKAGNDTLYAGAGDDIVVAGQGNDVVYGGSGNDEMMGGGGDDTLDGGDGIADTVVYAGMSTRYLVEYVDADSSFVITDSVTGSASNGKDTLKNVEQVKFINGLFALGAGGLTFVSATGATPPPSNMPGIVVVSGVGSAGHTLTATVSDADGMDGAITYQWQLSADNGLSWSAISEAVDKSYLLRDEDVGHLIQVVASYTDNGAVAEMPVSTPKTVLPAKEGDSLITLIHLDAPSGTIIINPLTTLLKDALDLGISPNIAAQDIKLVLGIPAEVLLQSYDAYTALLSNLHDPVALAVEKVAVQVAILTSLSDDDTGMNLTLAILDAAAANKSYDLGTLHDICSIMGLDPSAPLPESVSIIVDRNSSIASALNDGGDVAAIEHEWVDFCSTQDNVASTSIADLSIHINQAPQGSATFVLPEAVQDKDYTISSTHLLQGFTDPDGDTLTITALTSDAGGNVHDNSDGTWSLTTSPGYTGPVELTYSVQDGHCGSTAASQFFIVTQTPVGNSVHGLLTFWKTGAPLKDVTNTLSSNSIVLDSMTTGSDGLYQHLDMPDGTYALTNAKISGTAESNAIKANDALAALKIAVGMYPNADGSAVSPYQYLAADVNHDGQVKAADALNILKMAVKLSTAPEKEWLFMPESVGSETMSRTSVHWPENPIPVILDVDQELHIIGVVKGDVNGSWLA
ncbi:MAG: choice-of-anchor L domain-containing protein [Candidatus Omnitrophota bacterium]